MRSALTVVILALLVGGCAAYSLYNPNVPPEIADRDSQECREQARQLVNWTLMDDDQFWSGPGWRHRRGPFYSPMTSGLAMEQDVYDRCMRYKGYTLIKQERPTAAGQ
jgi:hypothetical protein